MSFFINVQTMEFPVFEGEIRASTKASLPETLDNPPFPFAAVELLPVPAYDMELQGVAETAPKLVNGKWVRGWEVFDLPTARLNSNLLLAKETAKKKVISLRDSKESEGFTYLGSVFDSDSKALARVSIAVSAARAAKEIGQSYSVLWTTKSNSTISLTADQLLAMPIAMAARAVELHNYARQLKGQIALATTIAELRLIDIESGWPGL